MHLQLIVAHKHIMYIEYVTIFLLGKLWHKFSTKIIHGNTSFFRKKKILCTFFFQLY